MCWRRVGGLVLAVSLGLPAIAGPALRPLDPRICGIISDYDARPDKPGLLEQFEHMVFGSEYCFGVQGACRHERLSRWETGISLTVVLPERMAVDRTGARRVRAALAGAFDWLAAPLVLDEDDFESLRQIGGGRFGHLVVVIGDRDEWRAAAARLEPHYGAPLSVSVDRVVADGADCFISQFRNLAKGQRLDHAIAWIDDGLDEDLLAKCVREEAFNLFIHGDPIGDGSLFHDRWGRAEPTGYSARDEALLRLLYHPSLRVGMPRAAVMSALRAAIASECDQ